MSHTPPPVLPETRSLDLAVVAGIRLGAPDDRAQELADYLGSIRPHVFVLIGEPRGPNRATARAVPRAHRRLLRALVRMCARGCRIYYLCGGPDAALHRQRELGAGNLYLRTELVLRLGNRRYRFLRRVRTGSGASHSADRPGLVDRVRRTLSAPPAPLRYFRSQNEIFPVEGAAYDTIVGGAGSAPVLGPADAVHRHPGDWNVHLTALELSAGDWSLHRQAASAAPRVPDQVVRAAQRPELQLAQLLGIGWVVS